jgi:hypothetical protein
MKGNNKMNYDELIKWLLDGDPSIVYRTKKELLNEDETVLEILKQSLPYVEGYINKYLDLRDNVTGLWSKAIYQPKFISTHYTMLELKNMGCPSNIQAYQKSAVALLNTDWLKKSSRGKREPDLCVMAMIGSIVCYGKIKDDRINEIVDYILKHIQTDGGFNCAWERSEVSSVHTTLTTLQFFLDYENNSYCYRLDEILSAVMSAEKFLLVRNLFQRRYDNKPIHKAFLNMPYPTRWQFDFLKALEYFVDRGRPYQKGMKPALDLLENKRLKSNAWPSTGNHPGIEFFKIKDDGRNHRINTLRALKVLRAYRPELIE